jgi:hypothetical protein
MMKRALRQGLIAGTAGGLVMTVGEKIEQSLTGRPDSHVTGRVLERLTGRPERRGKQPLPVNWAMHFGQAAVLGVVRSIMVQAGLRGPLAQAWIPCTTEWRAAPVRVATAGGRFALPDTGTRWGGLR